MCRYEEAANEAQAAWELDHNDVRSCHVRALSQLHAGNYSDGRETLAACRDAAHRMRDVAWHDDGVTYALTQLPELADTEAQLAQAGSGSNHGAVSGEQRRQRRRRRRGRRTKRPSKPH